MVFDTYIFVLYSILSSFKCQFFPFSRFSLYFSGRVTVYVFLYLFSTFLFVSFLICQLIRSYGLFILVDIRFWTLMVIDGNSEMNVHVKSYPFNFTWSFIRSRAVPIMILYPKRHFIHHACATWIELPSNISTMERIGINPR